MSTKRQNGQYFTKGDPFKLRPFQEWADRADLHGSEMLEPFAGANDIVTHLKKNGFIAKYRSFDIKPQEATVEKRNTIASFPTGFRNCVTNPPWLARNSATRQKLTYPDSAFDDLYKHCLDLCLANCDFVAALVPATILQSGLFRARMESYILLHEELFDDTENPVCLVLFDKDETATTRVFHDTRFVGDLADLEDKRPEPITDRKLRFNDPAGQLGFYSFDNTHERSIMFCHGDEIDPVAVKESSRFITRISGDFGRSINGFVRKLNTALERMRDATHDVVLTPFKGIRDDGEYRRRMEYSLTRDLINAH